MHTRSRLVSVALLTALLLVAHVGVAAHAFEHDTGAPQTKTCSICVTAAQFGATSVADLAIDVFLPPVADYRVAICTTRESRPVFIARQRGPPPPP